jgi:glycosyltransferase involved in cell wall biosynthesis
MFPLVCDCTEWYKGKHLPGGTFGLSNADNQIRIRLLYPCIKNILVISSFLENYLKKRSCNTIVLPPMVDKYDQKWKPTENAQIQDGKKVRRLIYAGDPGKKDLLLPLFHALAIINKDVTRVEITLLGIEPKKLNLIFPWKEQRLPSYIKCLGRVPMNKVPEHYMQSDYSVLLREPERYAQAGFPTKLVESLCSGIPVITNRTSDIPKFIQPGINGFLLENTNVSSLVNCLENVCVLSGSEIFAMKVNARKSGNESFDYRKYSDTLDHYFRQLS